MKKEHLSINGKIFDTISLLGQGKGGYSWLVTDGVKKYVLKQIHHEPCEYYQFGNKLESELKDYHTLYDLGIPVPQLLDVDEEEERLLKVYIPGPTIAQLVADRQMKQAYFEDIQKMCQLLYSAGLNIDYYPTNFVVMDEKLWYVDYECNPYDEKWNFDNWGKQYWTITD